MDPISSKKFQVPSFVPANGTDVDRSVLELYGNFSPETTAAQQVGGNDFRNLIILVDLEDVIQTK